MMPRGIRNNNFGNIEDGPFARGLPGYTGTDGRFAQFQSPQDGLNAIDRLLQTYGNKGINSVPGIVGRWAPSSDGNDVSAYSNFITKQTGLSDGVNLADPDARSRIASAIAQYENGAPVDAATKAAAAPVKQATDGTLMGSSSGDESGGGDFNWGRALQGAGASLMAISDPMGARAMAGVMAQSQPDANKFSIHVDPNTGTVFRLNTNTGAVTTQQNPNGQRKVSDATLLKAGEEMGKWTDLHNISTQAAETLDDINSGKLNLGLIANVENKVKNGLGLSDDESRAYAKFEQFKQTFAYIKQLEAKGVQTEGDARRAIEMLAGGNATLDNATAKDALQKIIAGNGKALTERGGAMLQSFESQAPGSTAFQPYRQNFDSYKKWYGDRAAMAAAPSAAASTAAPAASRPPLSSFQRK